VSDFFCEGCAGKDICSLLSLVHTIASYGFVYDIPLQRDFSVILNPGLRSEMVMPSKNWTIRLQCPMPHEILLSYSPTYPILSKSCKVER